LRSDHEIREEVLEELDRDPQIAARDIAVALRDGVVTLAGFVRSHGERARAEAIAKRIEGVGGIANDIEVRMALFDGRPDPEVARELVAAIRNELPTLCERIRVHVASGRVTLEGDVDWHEHRLQAEELAGRVRGVSSISNEIVVAPHSSPPAVERPTGDGHHGR
jgi:osmotically-inducible protein OsmY